MKIITPVLLSLAFVTTLFSCQKEVSSEPGYTGSSVSGTLKFKVDGQQWIANKLSGAYIMTGKINITGQSKDGRLFTMTLSDTKARKYILTNVITNFDSAHFAAFTDGSTLGNNSWGTEQGDDTTLAGGWVIVSKIDNSKKTISGTFEMKMFREADSSIIHITEGAFENLHFETSLPPANASDTLNVKIEGVAWKATSISSVATPAGAGAQIVVVGNETPMNRTVSIMMPTDITAGTYTLDWLGGSYIGAYNPNATTAYASTSGTLTILEHNTTTKRIRGNFNFIAEPALGGGAKANLTEGYFSVKYQ